MLLAAMSENHACGLASRAELLRVLAGAQEAGGYDSVATGRSSRVILLRHVDIFLRYRPWITPGVILDWGCRHAPDAALIRATECSSDTGPPDLDPSVGRASSPSPDPKHLKETGKMPVPPREGAQSTLHGCDKGETRHAEAHARIGLTYRPLTHPSELPYDDATFDTIIASGVLEHAPDDDASLRELHRVLRPGGRLIITFLPNRLSYTEFLSRRVRAMHHRRLYTPGALRQQLLHRGFYPLKIARHQMLPSMAAKGHRFGKMLTKLAEHAYTLNRPAEAIPVVNRLASNLWAVAEKREMM